jgi:hypothetical protein
VEYGISLTVVIGLAYWVRPGSFQEPALTICDCTDLEELGRVKVEERRTIFLVDLGIPIVTIAAQHCSTMRYVRELRQPWPSKLGESVA